jgi:integrase/recombinase XerC
MVFEQQINDFISYIKHEENLSRNTVIAYHADLNDFFQFIEKQRIDKIRDLKYIYVRMYFAELHGKLDKRSIARKTSSIRAFLRYLSMQGYPTSELLGKLKNPKLPKKLMFALSTDEVSSFIGAINVNSKTGIRNLSIIELLYGAGIRVSELAGIKLNDINKEERTLKVLGKGRKERIVPFNREALNALEKYLVVRNGFEKPDKPSDILYLNKSGSPLGVRSIQRLVKFVSAKAGLLKSATPHTMRHSYATHMLEAGASIKTVKELLGHASIAATQRYTHLTMEKLTEMYKKAHPKA